jgi:tetratricopeptide (TPR) repeat protein
VPFVLALNFLVASIPQAFATSNKALGLSYQNIGSADCRLAKYNKSETELKRSLDLEEKAFGANDPHLVGVLNELGGLYTSTGHTTQARTYLNRAVTVNNGKDQIAQAESLNRLAQTFLAQGNPDKASGPSQKALDLRQRNLPMGDAKIAESLNTEATVALLRSELKDAQQQASNALALTGDGSPNQVERAASLDLLARIFIEEASPRKAKPLAVEALEIRQRVFGNKHPLVAESWMTYGAVSLQMRAFHAAEDAFRTSARILQDFGDAKKDEAILSLFALSCTLAAEGKNIDAKEILDQAVLMQSQLQSKDPGRVEYLRGVYAQALLRNGNWMGAAAMGATAFMPPVLLGANPMVLVLVASCSKRAIDVPIEITPAGETNELLVMCCIPIAALILYLVINNLTKDLFFARNRTTPERKKGDKNVASISGTYWTESKENRMPRNPDIRVLPQAESGLRKHLRR